MIGTCARCRGALRLASPGCLPPHNACFSHTPPLECDPQGLYDSLARLIKEREKLIEQQISVLKGGPINLITPLVEPTPNGTITNYILRADHPQYEQQQVILLDMIRTQIEVFDYRVHQVMREILEWKPKQMPGESDEVFKMRNPS